MKYGYVKVCAATIKIKVADVEFNKREIIKAIDESDACGSSVIVFHELCLSGYTCGDLFNQRLLITACEKAIGEIADATVGKDIIAFVGAPIAREGKLYNCAVAVGGGEILGVVPKTFLPNYGEFYEQRHFCRAPDIVDEVEICGKKVAFGTSIIFKANNVDDLTIAAEICEDLWAPRSPSISHALAGANIIVNLSCSDELVGKAEYRRDLVKMQSAKLICGYIYSDAGDGESTTDMAFAGHNIICENGAILKESKLFENGLIYSEIDVEAISNERRRVFSSFFEGKDINYRIVEFRANTAEGEISRVFPLTPFVPTSENSAERMELILTIQSKGLEKRILHTQSKSVVVGVSGGLDSALALLVAYRTFKRLNRDLKDVIAVTMPCFGTTSKTKNNSIKLIEALGVTEKIIPIEKCVKLHLDDIGQEENKFDATYENAQARMRTLVLMDLANKCGGLVIGTGDLSELALGWATYNGDHMSMYSVNCSVPKTLVKELVRYEGKRIGGKAGSVLSDILNTQISPELLPVSGDVQSQSTEDIIGPYVLHDFFLYYIVRFGFEPEKVQYIAEHAFEGVYEKSEINKWLKVFIKRFFSQQFKRSCVPDGVKIGSVALSPRGDWRMPSDAMATLWLDDANI